MLLSSLGGACRAVGRLLLSVNPLKSCLHAEPEPEDGSLFFYVGRSDLKQAATRSTCPIGRVLVAGEMGPHGTPEAEQQPATPIAGAGVEQPAIHISAPSGVVTLPGTSQEAPATLNTPAEAVGQQQPEEQPNQATVEGVSASRDSTPATTPAPAMPAATNEVLGEEVKDTPLLVEASVDTTKPISPANDPDCDEQGEGAAGASTPAAIPAASTTTTDGTQGKDAAPLGASGSTSEGVKPKETKPTTKAAGKNKKGKVQQTAPALDATGSSSGPAPAASAKNQQQEEKKMCGIFNLNEMPVDTFVMLFLHVGLPSISTVQQQPSANMPTMVGYSSSTWTLPEVLEREARARASAPIACVKKGELSSLLLTPAGLCVIPCSKIEYPGCRSRALFNLDFSSLQDDALRQEQPLAPLLRAPKPCTTLITEEAAATASAETIAEGDGGVGPSDKSIHDSMPKFEADVVPSTEDEEPVRIITSLADINDDGFQYPFASVRYTPPNSPTLSGATTPSARTSLPASPSSSGSTSEPAILDEDSDTEAEAEVNPPVTSSGVRAPQWEAVASMRTLYDAATDAGRKRLMIVKSHAPGATSSSQTHEAVRRYKKDLHARAEALFDWLERFEGVEEFVQDYAADVGAMQDLQLVIDRLKEKLNELAKLPNAPACLGF